MRDFSIQFLRSAIEVVRAAGRHQSENLNGGNRAGPVNQMRKHPKFLVTFTSKHVNGEIYSNFQLRCQQKIKLRCAAF